MDGKYFDTVDQEKYLGILKESAMYAGLRIGKADVGDYKQDYLIQNRVIMQIDSATPDCLESDHLWLAE